MKLTIFDLINLMVFFSSVFFAVYNGFIKSLINLTAFLISILGAIAVFPYAEKICAKYIANEIAHYSISVLASYLISLVFTSFAKHYVLKFTTLIRGNILDRALGLIVGVIRGAFFCLIIFWVAMFFTSKKMVQGKHIHNFTDTLTNENYPKWFTESETFEVTTELNDFIINILPKEILNYDLSKLGIDKLLNQAVKSRKSHQNKNSLDIIDHPELQDIDKELLGEPKKSDILEEDNLP
jgi:uncharacterized membrane protein required for colicin V production